MQTFVVILDNWPLKDAKETGKAMATALGGTPTDRAILLRTCRGLVAEGLQGEEADALISALGRVGCKAWRAPEELVPRLPKARTSRRVDPTREDNLLAQVRMTGPPDALPWRRILAAIPAEWIEQRTIRAKPAAKGRGAADVVMSLAMTGGVSLLFNNKNGGDDAAAGSSKTGRDPMLELVVAGPPLRRYHLFASRMNYSALGLAAAQGAENWEALLRALRQHLRPEVTGAGLIDRYIARGTLPKPLRISDANDLGRTTRWLMLRAALRRLEARSRG